MFDFVLLLRDVCPNEKKRFIALSRT